MSEKKKIEQLRSKIQKHDHLYYVLSAPVISDYAYDQLFSELKRLEKKFPHWRTPDSPTQRVGGQVLDSFQKAPHRKPMMSLDNSYSIEEVRDFTQKIEDHLGRKQTAYFCEPKLDGIAIELIYKKGILIQALTRGDGRVGEDVLANIRTIRSVPLKLQTADPPDLFEVRGEAVLFKKDFEELNKQQKKRGEKIFANPRNAASGALRNLDSKITAQRKLKFFCHGIGEVQGASIPSQNVVFDQCKKWGLPVFSYQHFPKKKLKWMAGHQPLSFLCGHIEQLTAYWQFLKSIRSKLPFEIDGIVIKLNSFQDQARMGQTARHPKWATAFKFPPQEIGTKIKEIFLQVGRTGVVTPVARMEPVPVAGVIVSQATLHNYSEIQKKDIREGDRVQIKRAGDVIPEVVKVIDPSARGKNTRPFKMPSHCPSCKKQLSQIEDLFYCLNQECQAVQMRKLQHFCSKKAMNIESLGDKIIIQLFEKGLVSCFSDIYRLKAETLESLPGFGPKLAENIIQSIEKSKICPLSRFIFALGIRHIGETMAIQLSSVFYSFDQLLKASEENLVRIENIGPIAARSIVTELKKIKNEVYQLFREGVKITKPRIKAVSYLSGKKFVITGSFQKKRSEIESIIQRCGGKVSSHVTQKTDYILCGDKPGSKYSQAQKLKIKQLNWNQFEKLLSSAKDSK